MLEVIIAFLTENAVALGGGAATLTIVEIIFSPFRGIARRFKKPETVRIHEDDRAVMAPKPSTRASLTVPEFIAIRRELKEELLRELAEAEEHEIPVLRARIAELESQIANPDTALAEANKRIADLEALLERSGNEIGTERIEEAKAAMEQGDYSIADEIFSEIEARNQLAVEEAARAAFGRGEVAEAEVRWADAATHYQRSASLDPSYRTLSKAHEFTHWSGDYETAFVLGEKLIRAATNEGHQPNLAMALNDHAVTVQAQGRVEEAEGLYQQALEIDRATIGEGHPDYATHLNNLALVVEAQGRYEEAERLYRDAVEITRATIGTRHPDYAIRLNNLAAVVQAQGGYEEAEGLYQQALEIDRATIGEQHPDYAKHLNNLAVTLATQERFDEAEPLMVEALAIREATLPPDHPDIESSRRSLAKIRALMGKGRAQTPDGTPA